MKLFVTMYVIVCSIVAFISVLLSATITQKSTISLMYALCLVTESINNAITSANKAATAKLNAMNTCALN